MASTANAKEEWRNMDFFEIRKEALGNLNEKLQEVEDK